MHIFILGFFGDVSSAVERVQKYQYMTIVDRHVIIIVEQPRPFGAEFCIVGCKSLQKYAPRRDSDGHSKYTRFRHRDVIYSDEDYPPPDSV